VLTRLDVSFAGRLLAEMQKSANLVTQFCQRLIIRLKRSPYGPLYRLATYIYRITIYVERAKGDFLDVSVAFAANYIGMTTIFRGAEFLQWPDCRNGRTRELR
jgi:hypothetical protein